MIKFTFSLVFFLTLSAAQASGTKCEHVIRDHFRDRPMSEVMKEISNGEFIKREKP